MHGLQALRECSVVDISDADIKASDLRLAAGEAASRGDLEAAEYLFSEVGGILTSTLWQCNCIEQNCSTGNACCFLPQNGSYSCCPLCQAWACLLSRGATWGWWGACSGGGLDWQAASCAGRLCEWWQAEWHGTHCVSSAGRRGDRIGPGRDGLDTCGWTIVAGARQRAAPRKVVGGCALSLRPSFPCRASLYGSCVPVRTQGLELKPVLGRHLLLMNRSEIRLVSGDAAGGLADARAAAECAPHDYIFPFILQVRVAGSKQSAASHAIPVGGPSTRNVRSQVSRVVSAPGATISPLCLTMLQNMQCV